MQEKPQSALSEPQTIKRRHLAPKDLLKLQAVIPDDFLNGRVHRVVLPTDELNEAAPKPLSITFYDDVAGSMTSSLCPFELTIADRTKMCRQAGTVVILYGVTVKQAGSPESTQRHYDLQFDLKKQAAIRLSAVDPKRTRVITGVGQAHVFSYL